jgi:hypothetical protein
MAVQLGGSIEIGPNATLGVANDRESSVYTVNEFAEAVEETHAL